MADPLSPTPPLPPSLLPGTLGSATYPLDVVSVGNRILADNALGTGLHDMQGLAADLVTAQQHDLMKADMTRQYVEQQLLPADALQLPQAMATARATANARPVDTTHPVTVPTQAGEEPRAILDKAYREMATRAGLSPDASAEFARRAGALDDGQVHARSDSPLTGGAALAPATVAQRAADGRIEVAPTAAQAGLLKLLAAQDAQRANGTLPPSGAAAGIPFTPQAGGKPGNTAVTPDIAAELLRNLSEGKPAFKPELGQVGGVSWFVTGGDPYVGVGKDKSVTLPVEIDNTSGKPVMQFDERALLEIYNARTEQAQATVEAQVRASSGKTNGEPLSNRNIRDIERRTSQLAERQMWTEVGERVAASESGVGKVTLQDSVFSKNGNGEFTLTSRGENVRIKGGTQALLDVIKSKGTPVEPDVLKAAEDMATREGWAGRVQGAFRVGGRVLIVVGIAADAYRIYTAEDKVKTVVEVAGGWAGATAAGGAFATAFAPADVAGPWAWAAHGLGTLAAGGLGYLAGSEITRTIYELAVEGQPIDIGP